MTSAPCTRPQRQLTGTCWDALQPNEGDIFPFRRPPLLSNDRPRHARCLWQLGEADLDLALRPVPGSGHHMCTGNEDPLPDQKPRTGHTAVIAENLRDSSGKRAPAGAATGTPLAPIARI
ncbi:hypothetical protein GCM10022420_027190 [Streptomyces iranensis]